MRGSSRADGVQDRDDGVGDGLGGHAGGWCPQEGTFEWQAGAAEIRVDGNGRGIWPASWLLDGQDGHVANAGQVGSDAVASEADRDGSQVPARLIAQC